MTTQELMQDAFNRVWRHFIIEKNRPGFDADAQGCRYRTSDGRRCAVGVLIPDDKYGPWMEGIGVPGIAHIIGPEYHNEDVIRLLSRLQRCHDSVASDGPSEFTGDLAKLLRVAAANYNLTVPEEGTGA